MTRPGSIILHPLEWLDICRTLPEPDEAIIQLFEACLAVEKSAEILRQIRRALSPQGREKLAANARPVRYIPRCPSLVYDHVVGVISVGFVQTVLTSAHRDCERPTYEALEREELINILKAKGPHREVVDMGELGVASVNVKALAAALKHR